MKPPGSIYLIKVQQSKALAFLIFLCVLCFIFYYDRANVVDNQNYVDYFLGGRLDAIYLLMSNDVSFLEIFALLIAEEFLWSIITELFSVFFNPEFSVYVLVALVNVTVFLSIWRMNNSLLALLLWLIIPVGFSVVGFFQLRQGLAFSLLLYGAYKNKTLLWVIAASLIHTTAVLPALFYLIYYIFIRGKGYAIQILVSSLCAFALAIMGGYVFENFGGRRLDTYNIEDGATSLFYVIGSSLLMIFYLWSFIRSRSSDAYMPEGYISLAGFGVCLFSAFSFYLFPVGTLRVGYFMYLFLIPLLSNKYFFNPAEFLKPRSVLGYLTAFFMAYQSFKVII